MNRNRAAVSAVAVALLTAGLAVGPAGAATATEAKARVGADWTTQSILFTAAPGQANDLNVFSMYTSEGIKRIGIRDVVPLEPGDHCAYARAEDTTSVVCKLPADSPRPDRIDAFLGDGDDTIAAFTPGVNTVSGGPGDDELHAHTARTVLGGAGDDTVMGPATLHGGDGMDHLMGDDGDQRMWGGPGDDMIEGYGGDDTVYAGSGDDHVMGGDGRDSVLGGPGDDMLHGEDGDDLVCGGTGKDTLDGGDGRDIVLP
ncbi:hemolysin-type calcium-binding protein [Streptomyces sp. WAC 04229]|uniref:calcium-binding protein n=1 Tax=Streptomyces sp. WAC 04229 TaxID=2203206 RepID=UPI000F738253|nr:calcium-binding protein [Streptomyces sp. WAC 04229]RSN66712.1 hemolysin-type calcium-binding protein [Streptomyces sp. WAC 04229]